MAKRALVKPADDKPIRFEYPGGAYVLTATGLEVTGRPSYEQHLGVGDFIKRAYKRSGWWLADWLRYGDERRDWHEKLSQAEDVTGLSEKTLKNVRAIGKIDPSRRRDGVEFALHGEVAGLDADEQAHWLEQAEAEGWTRRELRMNIRAARRRRIIEGQAFLEGLYRVIYADPPWLYGDRPASGSGAADHFPGMTIEEMCKLPIAAHATPNAVLFMWVTAPMLYENPGPREVIEAWGFMPKTGRVWNKVLHAGGHYVESQHEHLIIATRGSCLPDRPTPMLPSVVTERRDPDSEHSAKPESFRRDIERLYDGPYLELFGRDPVAGWTVFGNDAALWAGEVAPAEVEVA